MQAEFNEKTQAILEKAQSKALVSYNQELTCAHVVVAMLGENTFLDFALNYYKVNKQEFSQELSKILNKIPQVRSSKDTLNISLSLSRVIGVAKQNSKAAITEEDLLIALAQDGDQEIVDLFKKFSLTAKKLKELVNIHANTADAEQNKELLAKYGQDLTQKAQDGKLDPVIGRDEEIRRVIEILSRRKKNNPVLIGEPGVGKTAIAEGLALRIVSGDVPTVLKNKTIYALDLSSLVAGAKFRGEFEERLKNVINVVAKSEGQIIMFIDELHTVVGAGASEGSMDAGNILKPMLARGELKCIGATTLNEYRKYIEKDAALERRFQPIMINQPSVEATISILRGLKERYEAYHGVRIKDSALVAAAVLSNRYITDRFLPDKAIDLVDEATARLKTQIDSMPAELDERRRRILQLEIEEHALKQEVEDKQSQERLQVIQSELAAVKQEAAVLETRWRNEKTEIARVRELKREIDLVHQQMQSAEREYNLGRLAELQYGKLPELVKQLQELEEKVTDKADSLLKEVVDEEDISRVVSSWTNIPVQKLLTGEREKLLHLQETLSKRVVGQEEAIQVVSDAILRARAGIKDPNRPIGSFIFLGSTGVGKTELAKALAEVLFDDEHKMVRIDMSEYMEKHAVAKLIGAPPGYVGYDEGGQLTETVRRSPYCVLLLDEIEKAHSDVFNILLQVLDDGRLTDSHGRVVDFKNTIIIMTSNLGSKEIIKSKGQLDANYLRNMLGEFFRPEFLNRLDDIIVFKPLGSIQVKAIANLLLCALKERIAEQVDIEIKWDDDLLALLAEAGFDEVFGARPLRRLISQKIETMLSKLIIAGDIQAGDKIELSVNSNGEISINK